MIWLFSIIAFVVVLSLVMAVYMFLSSSQSASGATHRRLNQLTPSRNPQQEHMQTLIREDSLSTIPLLDRVLGSVPQLTDLKRLLEQAGRPFNLGTLVLMSGLVAAMGMWLGAWRQSLPMALVLGAVGAFLPVMYLRILRKRRLDAFDEQFPEAVDLMARALRAGHSFTSAMRMVADELEDPVAQEFRSTFEDYSYGKSLSDALNAMVERVGLQDLKFFTTAVMLQRETGGNLTEILDNIGYIIRERFRLMRQVKALSAEGRLSATILTLMPPVLMLVLWVVSPKYLEPLFTEDVGNVLLWAGAGLQLVGIVVIRRLIKMDV